MEKPHWSRHAITIVLIVSAIGFMFLRGGCPQERNGRGHITGDVKMVRVDGWPLHVEIADTPELRRRGLGDRQELLPGHGILFVFESPEKPALVMENTNMALSVAFISDEGIIEKIEDLVPYDLRKVSPKEPVIYVLGVRGGFFADHGISPGAEFHPPESIAGPASVPVTPQEEE